MSYDEARLLHKLEIKNLGALGDKDEDNSLDLGGFF